MSLSKSKIKEIEQTARNLNIPSDVYIDKLEQFAKRDRKKEFRAKLIGATYNSNLEKHFREYVTDDGLGIVLAVKHNGQVEISSNVDLSKEIIQKRINS